MGKEHSAVVKASKVVGSKVKDWNKIEQSEQDDFYIKMCAIRQLSDSLAKRGEKASLKYRKTKFSKISNLEKFWMLQVLTFCWEVLISNWS